MIQFKETFRNRHLDPCLKSGHRVKMLATGETGSVVCCGRDKHTCEDVVCVELDGKPEGGRWVILSPSDLTLVI